MAKTKKQKTCKVTHAITKDSYPNLPAETQDKLITEYKVGDTIRVKNVYFENGETQVCGYLNDTDKLVTLPSVWTDL